MCSLSGNTNSQLLSNFSFLLMRGSQSSTKKQIEVEKLYKHGMYTYNLDTDFKHFKPALFHLIGVQ